MVKLTETQKVRELIKLSTEDSEEIRKLREDLEHERECARQTRKLITEYEFVIEKLRAELEKIKSEFLDATEKLKIAREVIEIYADRDR